MDQEQGQEQTSEGGVDGQQMIDNLSTGIGNIADALAGAPNGGKEFAMRMKKLQEDFMAIVSEAMQANGQGGGSAQSPQGSAPMMDQSQGQPMGMQGGMR